MFSQKTVAEMKEGFQIMDRDKDGILNKEDLRSIFDEIGRIISDDEISEMLGEADGPVNFTMFLNMFAEKNKGEVDDDEVIKKAFLAYSNEEGFVDCDNFRHALMTWGDKYSAAEVDDTFQHLPIDDDNQIDVDELISMLTAGSGGDEEWFIFNLVTELSWIPVTEKVASNAQPGFGHELKKTKQRYGVTWKLDHDVCVIRLQKYTQGWKQEGET